MAQDPSLWGRVSSGGPTDSHTGELLFLVILEMVALAALRWFSRHHHGG